MTRARIYTHREELANTASHAAGIVMGIVAGYLLLSKTLGSHDSVKTVSVIVYLFGMLSCYVTSTLYHGCRAEKKKKLLQKFDHAAIYIHIAATYTPFTMIALRESLWGELLFGFIWLTALVGIFFSFRKSGKHSHLETICYVVMGCSVFAAFKPLIDVFATQGGIDSLYWLVGGGISYIVGAIFYSFAKIKYMHTVFHFFVLGGSVCHIIAISIIL